MARSALWCPCGRVGAEQGERNMDRRKFLIAAGSTAVGTSALVGSGAFSAARLSRGTNIQVANDANALIGLVPGHHFNFTQSSRNGSSVDSSRVRLKDGELFIDFQDSQGGQGMNYNSTYQVGAVGWEDASFSDAQSGLDIQQSDVIYGDSANSGEPYIWEDPAFVVTNQSNSEIDLEMAYDATKTPDNGRGALLVEPGSPDNGAGTTGNNQGEIDLGAAMSSPEGLLTATLGSGESVSLSLITVMGDKSDGGSNDWEGTIEVWAEEATQNMS
jgi:hypothetical protein